MRNPEPNYFGEVLKGLTDQEIEGLQVRLLAKHCYRTVELLQDELLDRAMAEQYPDE